MAAGGDLEIDYVLSALALDENHEPAATVVRKVCAPRGALGSKAALIAPDAAEELVRSGGRVTLSLGDGLPDWGRAAAILGRISMINTETAVALLRSHVDALADSFVYQQANGGRWAGSFLEIVLQIDRVGVLEAMKRMPVTRARISWPERAKGPADVRLVLREFIALAREVGGEVADLADDVSAMMADDGNV